MDGWAAERSRHGGVDEIPLPSCPGRLFLCGKHFIGPDVEATLASVDATTVVCLNHREEIEARYPSYVAWLATATPSRAMWFPIHDLRAPGPADALVLLAELRSRLDAGERLLLHCGAGVGRAGTIAAALLMTMDISHEEALRTVAAHRPTGPWPGPKPAPKPSCCRRWRPRTEVFAELLRSSAESYAYTA